MKNSESRSQAKAYRLTFKGFKEAYKYVYRSDGSKNRTNLHILY